MLLVLTGVRTYAQKETDSIFIERALRQAPGGAGTLHFARLLMGRPYIAHTLEVNDEEQLVVNTRQLDCTTLVETVTALTLCVYRHLFTWRDYLNALSAMRYRYGQIDDYTSRIHYFTEWITLNTEAGIVREIQAPNPPFSAVQTVNVDYMSTHPTAYKALKAQRDEMDARLDAMKAELIDYVASAEKTVKTDKADKLTVGQYVLTVSHCSRDGIDEKRLRAERPDVASEYTRTTFYDRFGVK
jgi:hypothetical protein